MASSSSPPSLALVHDVFVSCRCKLDTRSGFTNYLYEALNRVSLTAFRDDANIEPGEEIQTAVLNGIHRSRIFVILFSTDYASSGWCLDELVCIMECWEREDRLVLPVFYGVDPSDVRNHKALEKHHRSGASGTEEQSRMLQWRAALNKAANICGWDAKNVRHEAELVHGIVKCIQSKGLPTRLNMSIYPLRYDICDEYLKVFLQAGSQNVVVVGICGPSQMGKTAMAKVMYDRILHYFDGGCSFLSDVGQRSNQPNYLVRLRETLLSDILSERNVKISYTRMGIDLIAHNLCSKRVLVVLDNVNDLRQIHAFVGDRTCFGSGSKIIITTRHVQLLEVFGADQFILAQGRPLHENVGAIWEPYQRSRCVVAGLKECIELKPLISRKKRG